MGWPVLACLLYVSLTPVEANSAVWLDVPFVAQPHEGCGAASIAMILEYWRGQGFGGALQAAEVGDIQRALFSVSDHGIHAAAVRDYFETHGFRTHVFRGDRALLAHHLARGRPLMVGLRPPGRGSLHYVVVVGVEQDKNVILVNDPAQRKLLKVRLRDFEREWQATGNWTLLAVPEFDSP
jgi:ABC-type bacteriocin/lantibiotic exporter with double-glycine peptidase domain